MMDTARDITPLLDAILAEVRPRILAHGFQKDSCVAATRITLDVLNYFGVRDARPVPVIAQAWNRAALDLLREKNGDMEEVARILKAIPADVPGGPWSVGIGIEGGVTSHSDARGAGHVIVGFPAFDLAMDMTLDQASRPHKNMPLTPYWFPVDSNWWNTERAVEMVPYPTYADRSWWPSSPDASEPIDEWTVETMLIYTHAEPRYLQSPNWRRTGTDPSTPATFKAITGESIRAIKAALG